MATKIASNPSSSGPHFLSFFQGSSSEHSSTYLALCYNSQIQLSQFLHSLKGQRLLLRQLVTDEPVEFEKSPVEVGDLGRITGHSRRIYRRIYLQ